MDSSTTRTDAVIRQYINQAMEAKNVTQADLSKALDGRSKGYISDRVLGKRSWAISELDRISPLLGLPDALSLIAAACGSAPIDGAREYEARERESRITDDLVTVSPRTRRTTTWPRTEIRTRGSRQRRQTNDELKGTRMTEYNLYCDETCHLEHDDSNSMRWEPSSYQRKTQRNMRQNQRNQAEI